MDNLKSDQLCHLLYSLHRASFKERGVRLIEEKVKPAFKKIHDFYLHVSRS